MSNKPENANDTAPEESHERKKCGCFRKIVILALVAACASILILAAVVASMPLWLGPAVKCGANNYVPGLTETEFRIEYLSINPFATSLRLQDLHLKNPDGGYKADEAFALRSLAVDLKPGELADNLVHFTNIDIDGVYVSYIDANGTNNFDAIVANVMKNLKSGEEKEEEEKDEAKEKKPMKFVIDRLRVANVKIKYGFLPDIPLPTIELKDIGKEDGKDGASLDEIAQTLTETFMKAFESLMKGAGALTSLLGDSTASLLGAGTGAVSNLVGSANGLLDGAAESANGLLDGAAESAGGLLGGATSNATDAIGGAVGELTETAGSIGKSITGLFSADEAKKDAKDGEAKPDGAEKDAGADTPNPGAESSGDSAADALKSGADSVTDGAKKLFKGIGF